MKLTNTTAKEHRHHFYGTNKCRVCIECGYSPQLVELQKQHEAKLKEIREMIENWLKKVEHYGIIQRLQDKLLEDLNKLVRI